MTVELEKWTTSTKRVSESAKQFKNSFELESLEPRVLLSSDAFLAAAGAAGEFHHSTEVAHQASPSNHGAIQDHLTSQSVGASGIFEGVIARPVESHQPVLAKENLAVAGVAELAVQAKTTVVTVDAAPKISTASTATLTASTTSATGVVTQQLTTSLTASNGPPSTASVSQRIQNQSTSSVSSVLSVSTPSSVVPHITPPSDLYTQVIADIGATNGQSGGSTHTLTYNLGSATILGGAVTFSNASITFTLDGSNKVATVSVAADSVSLSLGGAVTSTIGSVTGNYNTATKTFSLALNNVKISISSFVSIGADSVSLTYTGASSTFIVGKKVECKGKTG